MKIRGYALLALIIPHIAVAESSSWNLPTSLSDQNLKVVFEVDSTWHMVHGTTSGLSGQAFLARSEDPSSVNVEIKIPVKKFNTDNESRDEELRDIFDEDIYPDVLFTASGLAPGCTPSDTISKGQCDTKLKGTIKIKDVSQELDLPISIRSEGNDFKISGEANLKWEEFHIEDPSIFVIATVDPVVKINFEVILKGGLVNAK